MKDIPLYEGERLRKINESLSLIDKTGALTFGTDAYLLSAFARAVPNQKAVDLGSGTGVISLLCQSKRKYRHMYAAELQPEFCELIPRNASLNELEDKITVIPGDIRELNRTHIGEAAAVVIANPPYLAAGAGLSHADTRMEAARRELNGTIADFCQAAARLIDDGGYFYTVFRPDRMTDLLVSLRSAGLEPKRMITVYPDTESRPCLLLTEARKGSGTELLVSPPLIIYRSGTDRMYTEAMQRIYDTFSMEFLFKKRGRRGI